LAELLNVSRQAVSKWEQDYGYPETEKLILLAHKLNLSLDNLMLGKEDDISKSETEDSEVRKTEISSERKIIVKSFDGRIICSCYKFYISLMLVPTKNEPKAILSGVDKRTLWGENSNVLGYYEHEEEAKKEVQAILEAIESGETSYDLKYYAKVKVGIISAKLTK